MTEFQDGKCYHPGKRDIATGFRWCPNCGAYSNGPWTAWQFPALESKLQSYEQMREALEKIANWPRIMNGTANYLTVDAEGMASTARAALAAAKVEATRLPTAHWVRERLASTGKP